MTTGIHRVQSMHWKHLKDFVLIFNASSPDSSSPRANDPLALCFNLGLRASLGRKKVPSHGGFNQQKAGWKWLESLEDSTNGYWCPLKLGYPKPLVPQKLSEAKAPQEFTDLDGHYQIGFAMMPQTWWLPSPPPKISCGIPASVTAASEHLEQPQRTARTSRTTRKHGPSTSYPIGSGITE